MGSVHNHVSGSTSGTVIQAGNVAGINTSTTTNTTVIGEVTGAHTTGSGDQVNTTGPGVHAPQLGPGSTYVAGNQTGGTGSSRTFYK
ncbi:hypothetical protein AB0910_12475 [Streptomyces sp. NPDC047002]|uniref:hypothetical protein n=1 Tax=Streptomyces sp. NPDC047002 TaxID=3155475 RepID=UPI0034547BEA